MDCSKVTQAELSRTLVVGLLFLALSRCNSKTIVRDTSQSSARVCRRTSRSRFRYMYPQLNWFAIFPVTYLRAKEWRFDIGWLLVIYAYLLLVLFFFPLRFLSISLLLHVCCTFGFRFAFTALFFSSRSLSILRLQIWCDKIEEAWVCGRAFKQTDGLQFFSLYLLAFGGHPFQLGA